MDNGLIFPYPRKSAHVEPSDAKRPTLSRSFGVEMVERAARASSSQAMG
jgi:hypothetical protein